MRAFALVPIVRVPKLIEVTAMQKQFLPTILGICLFFGGCLPSAREGSSLETVRRSTESIVTECAICHSTKEAQRGPILHGMDAWYLLSQIQKFHDGSRGQNTDNRSEYLMGIAVKKIRNKREMNVAAKWFAKQKPMPAIRTVAGDVKRGAALYVSRCAVCHGDKAEGKLDTASPSLTKLEGWYFIDQMRKFRNGQRGQNAFDPAGQVMATAVSDLTPQQISDVVAYVVDAFGPPEAPSLRQRFLPLPLEANASRQ